jgi:hypothetical protein
MRSILLSIVAAGGASLAPAAEFEKAVRMKGGDEFIRVEGPGWAAPCLADIDKDGKVDLLVGQFNKGKIKLYKGLGEMKFAAGEWLKAEGDVAEVPGVW